MLGRKATSQVYVLFVLIPKIHDGRTDSAPPLQFIFNISEKYCLIVHKSSVPETIFLARRLHLKSRKFAANFF